MAPARRIQLEGSGTVTPFSGTVTPLRAKASRAELDKIRKEPQNLAPGAVEVEGQQARVPLERCRLLLDRGDLLGSRRRRFPGADGCGGPDQRFLAVRCGHGRGQTSSRLRREYREMKDV